MKLQKTIKSLWRNLLTEKENANYSYGCVMITVDIGDDKWEEIQALINDDDIHEGEQYGREDGPHITILYGIHNNVEDEEIEELIEQIKPIKVTLDKVGIFPGDEYDVVKFEVSDKNLNKYNKLFRDNVKYTNDYPDYKAHLTIAYVKSGRGKEISTTINKDLEAMEFDCNEIKYSKANNDKKYYKLSNDGE